MKVISYGNPVKSQYYRMIDGKVISKLLAFVYNFPPSQTVFLMPDYITKPVYIIKMQMRMSSWGQQKQSRIALSLKLVS